MSQTISLVLGSGGARGLAHIGVIHELEKRNFDVRAITGCSVGSLIGGFYCAGKLDVFEEWVCNLSEWDVIRFLDISLTARNGVVKGDLIMNTLRDLIGDQRIEDLPIPFTAIATNIDDRKEVWLSKGSLFDAMRASMAIPGIFTPKTINGKTLVDGGLLDPLAKRRCNLGWHRSYDRSKPVRSRRDRTLRPQSAGVSAEQDWTISKIHRWIPRPGAGHARHGYRKPPG